MCYKVMLLTGSKELDDAALLRQLWFFTGQDRISDPASLRQADILARAYSSGSVVNISGKPALFARSIASCALVSAISLGADHDHACTELMGGHHDAIAGLLAHTKDGLQHHDDEFTRRVIVIDENNLIKLRPIDLLASSWSSVLGQHHCHSSESPLMTGKSGLWLIANLYCTATSHSRKTTFSGRLSDQSTVRRRQLRRGLQFHRPSTECPGPAHSAGSLKRPPCRKSAHPPRKA